MIHSRSSTSMVLAIALIVPSAFAQTYDTNGDFVQPFVGSGFFGDVDGVGANTMFYMGYYPPTPMVVDSHKNIFVWDSGNDCIRKITLGAEVSTFAGGHGTGYVGTGTNFSFRSVSAVMAIDHSDTIWVLNPGFLYKVTPSAVATYAISNAISSSGICSDSMGNIYYSSADKIFIYTNGVASVFVGSGNPGSIDGNGIFTAFYNPTFLTCDEADNIYVWDSGTHLIRKINQNRDVTTIAGKYNISDDADGHGTNAAFGAVNQMCCDHAGNLYLACGTCIRKIDAQTNVVTLAGSFTQSGYVDDIPGSAARFYNASGICFYQGNLFVADAGNERIRQITFNPTSQVVGAANLSIGTFAGITINGTVGRTYTIQSSQDLSSWSDVATILLDHSPYLWIDQGGAIGNKFYRAVMLP